MPSALARTGRSGSNPPMRVLIRAALTAAVLLLALPAAAQEPGSEAPQTGQTVDLRTLTDHDYRFRVTAPDQQWTVLDQDRAREINPAALAILQRPGGVLMAILVEPLAGDTTAAQMLEAVLHTVPGRTVEPGRSVERALDGEPALGQTRVLLFDGNLQIRMTHTVLLRDGYCFQFVCSGPPESHDAAEAERMLGAIDLMDGPIRQRVPEIRTPDSVGADFVIEDGRFRGLAPGAGVAVDPDPARFHVCVGDELLQIDPFAFVALTSNDNRAYATLTCFGCDDDEYAEMSGLARAIPSGPTTEATHEVFGHDREFEVWHSEFGGLPIRFRSATWIQGNTLWTLTLWQTAASTDDDGDAILDAMARSFRLLPDDERKRLRAEVLASSDLATKMQPPLLVRSGTFLDFHQGVSWKKPAGSAWECLLGEWTRALGYDDHGFVARCRERGLDFTYTYGVPGSRDAATYHRDVVESRCATLDVVSRGEPEELALATPAAEGVKLLRTRILHRVGGVEFVLWTATVRSFDGSTGIEAEVSSSRLAESHSPDEIRACFTALSFHSDLEPTADTTDGYIDRSFGFRVRVPEEFGRHAAALPQLGNLGTQFQVLRDGSPTLQVTAVCAPLGSAKTESMKRDWLTTVRRLPGQLTPDAWQESTLAGRPSAVSVFRRGTQQVGVAHIVGRGPLAYLVLAFGDAATCRQALAWLDFIDDPLHGIGG